MSQPDVVEISVVDGTPAATQNFVVGSLGQYAGAAYRIASVLWISANTRRVKLISQAAWERGVR